MIQDVFPYMLAILPAVAALIFALTVTIKQKTQAEADGELREAERLAFKDRPEALAEKLRMLAESQAGLEGEAIKIARLIETAKSEIDIGRLFNVYSKQIEKYQQQTRIRATWSFVFSIVAMSAGFVFVVWGGSVLLTAKEAIALTAGGLLSGVGGTVSAFITKTFLDVHRLSLTQLNHYFRQPVINDHILMAQRLAEDCKESGHTKESL